MSPAVHGFSVAVATTENAPTRADGLGWWVLVLALGVGTLLVLLMVALVDRLAAGSGARHQDTGTDRGPRPGEIPQQLPQAVLVGATTAAQSLNTRRTTLEVPARKSSEHAHRQTPSRPHLPMPRVPRPRIPHPHVSVPHVTVPRPRLPRPQRVLGPAVRRRLATGAAPRPRGRPRGSGAAVHVLAAVTLPAALGLRTLLDPGWWHAPATTSVVELVLAVTIAAVGLHWLRRTTERPRALRRRTRERLRAAEALHLARVDAARRLLAALDDDGGPPSAWAVFSREAGLHVPPRMRTLVSRQMDPEALVRYLGTQALEPTPTELPRWLAVAMPFACCLLPAALMIVVT